MARRRNPSAARLRRWHRLFGLLSEHLRNSPFAVELEADLSHRQQLLDVVVVRRRPGTLADPLPDALDDLADHNLITFKSYWESLTDWVLKELTGHYVNYRKQASPRGHLLPEDRFRLIAVSARQPRDLFDAIAPERLRPGVYDCRRGTDLIRVVVAAELPREDRNALLYLFSARPDQVQYGAEHYRMRSPDISTIVQKVFKEYRIEGLPMPYTIEDFRREIAREVLPQMTPAERVAGMSPEQILDQLPPEQIEAYLKQRAKRPTKERKKKPKSGR